MFNSIHELSLIPLLPLRAFDIFKKNPDIPKTPEAYKAHLERHWTNSL